MSLQDNCFQKFLMMSRKKENKWKEVRVRIIMYCGPISQRFQTKEFLDLQWSEKHCLAVFITHYKEKKNAALQDFYMFFICNAMSLSPRESSSIHCSKRVHTDRHQDAELLNSKHSELQKICILCGKSFYFLEEIGKWMTTANILIVFPLFCAHYLLALLSKASEQQGFVIYEAISWKATTTCLHQIRT